MLVSCCAVLSYSSINQSFNFLNVVLVTFLCSCLKIAINVLLLTLVVLANAVIDRSSSPRFRLIAITWLSVNSIFLSLSVFFMNT
nr:MAG TPA: hypothetical protein [Caudoviricetes sp.]